TLLGYNLIGCVTQTNEHLHHLRFDASGRPIFTDIVELWFDQELTNFEGDIHDLILQQALLQG
ncbi:MAG TPA: hypothetical protein VFP64_04515, partial [Pyrinomonadaceae bacterium]|nr:hypothetical protein [Pyrinomonadaceae bacterium]